MSVNRCEQNVLYHYFGADYGLNDEVTIKPANRRFVKRITVKAIRRLSRALCRDWDC